ncbi:MAG TPA: tripartite tricarboxylate transporter permease, partial [Kiloniellales bacterium]|nr:tripartite tricarboxylate transporter permease [Kiloniellales bacterium]
AIFGAMLLANIVFMGIGLVGAKVFSQITLIPRTLLWPAVFTFSMIGAYAAASSIFDVWVMLISGLVGFLMLRHGFGPAPLIMGLILGKLVEESFSQGMIMYDNNFLRFLESPIVLGLFALTFLSLFWPLISPWIKRGLGATFARRERA